MANLSNWAFHGTWQWPCTESWFIWINGERSSLMSSLMALETWPSNMKPKERLMDKKFVTKDWDSHHCVVTKAAWKSLVFLNRLTPSSLHTQETSCEVMSLQSDHIPQLSHTTTTIWLCGSAPIGTIIGNQSQSNSFMAGTNGLIIPRCGRLGHPEQCTLMGIQNADVSKSPWEETVNCLFHGQPTSWKQSVVSFMFSTEWILCGRHNRVWKNLVAIRPHATLQIANS